MEMVRSVNFLHHTARFRATALLGVFHARLATVGMGLGAGLAIVAVVWFAGAVHIHDLTAQLQIAQAQQRALDSERLKLQARLGGDIDRYQDLLPQVRLIRASGPNLADKFALLGNAAPVGLWVDDINYAPDAVTMHGGARSMVQIAALMNGLRLQSYHPFLTSNSPKKGRGVFFGYEIKMVGPQ